MENFTTLEAILSQLKEEFAAGKPLYRWDETCLYAAPSLCRRSAYHLSDPCVPAAGTVVGGDDRERLPPEIGAMGLELYCYGRDLADVVSSALEQRPGAGVRELLQALNYHSINDSFLNFSEAAKGPKRWNIGVFPGFPLDRLTEELSEREADVLRKGRLLEYPAGSVMIEEGDSELISLCNLISFQSGWALYLCLTLPSGDRAGRWSHHLYQGLPASPIRHPEDGKKVQQPRLIANADALSQAFPETEPELLAQYFQSDSLIADARRRWEQSMARRHRQKGWQPPPPPPIRRVRPADHYLSDDWRQVFDLLRYLSFPLENELANLS